MIVVYNMVKIILYVVIYLVFDILCLNFKVIKDNYI